MPVERGLFNYSPDRISPIKTSLYGVYYVSSFLPYPGREFLCWFKIISLRSDWYLKENFNRSDRFGEFKFLLTTRDGQPSFVTLVQNQGQFSLRSVGLPCDTWILVFIMTCLINCKSHWRLVQCSIFFSFNLFISASNISPPKPPKCPPNLMWRAREWSYSV